MQDKIDHFGFKGQSQDYDLARPRYPSAFIDKLKELPCLKNYIDLGTGTGLLFYEVAPYCTGALTANDKSKKQLEVAKEKVKESQLDSSRVEFIESDIFDVHNHLSKPQKYELVTIAQTLHWLDRVQFCQHIIKNVLAENGVLAILGYFNDGFVYNFPEDPEFAKQGELHFPKYYATILPYYDCDRESLDKGFSNFDFKQYFGNFERIDFNDEIEISVENFIKYLGSSSASNMYKNKFGNQPGFEDPVQLVKDNIEKDLKAYYEKHDIHPKEKPLLMKMHFFMLLLSKPKETL